MSAFRDTVVDGGAGNDVLHLYQHATGNGGDGDDRIVLNNSLGPNELTNDPDLAPLQVISGEGEDTIVIRAGDLRLDSDHTDGPYYLGTVTDFDLHNDSVLFDITYRFSAIGDIRTEPVDGQNAVDVIFSLYSASDPNMSTEYAIRLNGVSDLDALDILTVSDADTWFHAPEGVATDQSILIGTDGDDTLTPTDEAAVLAGEGNDLITANHPIAYVHGGEGDDTITVSDPDTVVYPGAGTDQVTVPMGATVTAPSAGDSITIQVPSGADDPDSFDGSVSAIYSGTDVSDSDSFQVEISLPPDWPHDTEVSLEGIESRNGPGATFITTTRVSVGGVPIFTIQWYEPSSLSSGIPASITVTGP